MVAKWDKKTTLLLSGLFWVIGLGNYPNRRKKNWTTGWHNRKNTGFISKNGVTMNGKMSCCPKSDATTPGKGGNRWSVKETCGATAGGGW